MKTIETMSRETFKQLHRTARLGNLGTLTATSGENYYWFLENVYDLRFPRIGENRHRLNGVRTFDPLRFSTAKRLAWKRQKEYCNQIVFCKFCKTNHHRYHDCPQ